MMTLLDAKPEKPKPGIFKYVPLPLLIVIVIGVAGAVTYYFWDYPEERAVSRFLTTLEQAKFQQAYKLWQPSDTYQYNDFLHDWGPKGDYGTIHSFEIVYVKSFGSHTVRVWVRINQRLSSIMVDRKTKGLSYPPPD
jgi:hypothetical protein